MFLTAADLLNMTGYKSSRGQSQWLAANGYSFDIRADGRPNVLVDQVRERQLKTAARARPRPNLANI